ncbi:unnamed protein product [Camellia sinensis]
MAKTQNCKLQCFSGILCRLLCIGSLLTQSSVPTTNIPTTTTTTVENQKKNFKTQVKTPGVVARLMGLDSLPDPRKIFRRKEDQKEKSGVSVLMGLDRLPSQQSLHRQHKGFSKTCQQWTAPVSSQRDGKPYELRSNRKGSMAQQECKDEYEVLETSKVERSSYPAKRTINSKLSEAEMAFIQQKFMGDQDRILSKMGEGTFGQVLECLDNENLEHLAMMERLLGPLPQHMIISANLCAKKYFKRSAHLDWLEGASSKESTRAVWKLPRLQTQNCKFKCFSGILCGLICIGSLLTQPSVPTTNIPTTNTTTVENQKKNFKTQVETPGVVARLMGLDSFPDPRKIFRRKADQKEKSCLLSISSQRDGKPFELRSNRKDPTAQQECKDEYEVLDTSKVERSSYPTKRTINSKLSEAEMAFIQQKFMADHDRILSKMGEGTFGQVLECLDNENLEHLAMMERSLGPLPQHMIISADLRAEKYFKRSAHLDWIEGASSKESKITPPTVKDSTAQQECKDEYEVLDTSKVERSSYQAKRTINSKLSEAEMAIQSKMGEGTFGRVLECLDNENLEHLAMMERLLGPLPQHMIISANLRAEKYFKRSAHLDWLQGASSKESTRAVWKLPRLQFKCFSGILCGLICIGSVLTQPSVPTTNIPTTTTTTVENQKKNFKTQVKPPGVVARLMADSEDFWPSLGMFRQLELGTSSYDGEVPSC